MLNHRVGAIGPLWLEEVAFLAIDEARRLPERIAGLANALAEKSLEAARWLSAPSAEEAATEAPSARHHAPPREARLLDEPEAWLLAVEPLVDMGTGAAAAAALHAAAAEQLDALTYGLDRLREELKPFLTEMRLGREGTVHRLESSGPSLEQLLELARENALTRPKERLLTAA